MTNSSEETDRTLIINLYGGPGTGKSTTAAATFALLKQNDINAELATEYAKDIVWEGRHYLLSDQLYIFAKQNRKLERLYGKVRVVVTDSPLYLCYYYSQHPHILGLIKELSTKAEQVHIFLVRKKTYNPKGRTQNEHEARRIDEELKAMLIEQSLEYEVVDADKEAASKILKLVQDRLNSAGQ